MLSYEQIWQLASQEGDTHDDSFIFNRDGRWSVLSFARAIESALSQSTEQGERDAARYRWLRQQRDPWGWKVQAVWKGESTVIQSECGERLDAAIDAAMSPHGDGVNYTRAEGGEDGNDGVPGTPNDQQEKRDAS